MSHLLDILGTHGETISRVFTHELGQANCSTLLGAENGGAPAMLAALVSAVLTTLVGSNMLIKSRPLMASLVGVATALVAT